MMLLYCYLMNMKNILYRRSDKGSVDKNHVSFDTVIRKNQTDICKNIRSLNCDCYDKYHSFDKVEAYRMLYWECRTKNQYA